jgi:hypothetical protein
MNFKITFFRADSEPDLILNQPWVQFFFLNGFGFYDPKLCRNDILNRFIYYGIPKSSSSTIKPVCRSQVETKNFLVLELISRLYMPP